MGRRRPLRRRGRRARPDQPAGSRRPGPRGRSCTSRAMDLQTTARVVGPSAFWTIVPGRPLWGSHRFVLRSTLPLGADREIAYPEVAPLGWGAVDAYLGIVNATGHPLASPDATGLKPIAYATHFRDREFTRDAGTPAGAFHVAKEVVGLACPVAPERHGTGGLARRCGARGPGRRHADRLARSLDRRPGALRGPARQRPSAHVRAPAGQHDPLVGRRAQSGRAAPIRPGSLVDRARRRPSGPHLPGLEDPADGGRARVDDAGTRPRRLAARVAPGRRRARARRWSRCRRPPAWRSRGFRRVSSRSPWPDWTRPGPTGWTSRSAMPWRRWTAAPAASTSDSWPC